MLFNGFQYYYLFLMFLLTESIEIEDKKKVKRQMHPHHHREKQCYDVPDEWLNRVVATDTWGLCIDMYDGKNCTGGKHIRLYPGNPDHWGLHLWNFTRSLASVKLCDQVVNGDNYKEKGNTVTLFAKSNYTGPKLHLNIFGCTNVPSLSWIKSTLSIRTYSKCYDFYADLNCTGQYISGRGVSKRDGLWFDDLKTKIKSIDDHCNAELTVDESTEDVKYEEADNTTEEYDPAKENTQKYDTKDNSIVIIASNVSLLLIFIAICIFVIFHMKKKFHKKQVELELENQKFIEYFMNGNSKAYDNISYDIADALYRATNAPYDPETYEIPLKCLKIDRDHPLGAGQFGFVSKAKVVNFKFPQNLEVAVKSVKSGADSGYVKSLLEELKIMMYIKKDMTEETTKHVVNLIGACTENIYKLEPYIILEFCSHGSLEKYLRTNRKTFYDLVENGVLKYPSDESQLQEKGNAINTLHLIRWSRDIADGMDFLASKKVIHGDLAARNVLLDGNLNAKISDFGFSRHLYQYSLYVKTQEMPLPWKWMAIESLLDNIFSTQSDVWSFGVTLWEIFSLGNVPFPGKTWTPEFVLSLKNGLRMSRPRKSTYGMYELMLTCWTENPDVRPSFANLRQAISNFIDE